MIPLLVRTRLSAIHKQVVPSTSHLSVKIRSLKNHIPYYRGISHFTPLPMGEGPGEGPLGVECGAARSGGEAGSFFSLPSLAF